MGTRIAGTGPLRSPACRPWVLGGEPCWHHPVGTWGGHRVQLPAGEAPGALSTESCAESMAAAVRLSPPRTPDREGQAVWRSEDAGSGWGRLSFQQPCRAVC